MADAPNPIRDTDDAARTQARGLIGAARFGALGVTDPETGAPMVTRIAVVPGPDGAPLTLISDLSGHSAALAANPACSLLLGEPGPRGDPLTHPRITLQCIAQPTDKTTLREHYLTLYPKAQLYYDFADFRMMRLQASHALLNGGFGKAFLLTSDDLVAPG
ncbi:pyridoxamine 5-phosphate oxidase [Rhodophyticola sp. CCM32]|uniref:HugZ family pyridoxamine 5'-phosphate oxidase n=1 Tax=Rhodophyticola sp. CCM32 TaxID=2916397 RepID=UPI00107F22C0|nr:pyridoxamine 5-phosphate oxidase [Rhodophyticola sp. CCM32]QBY01207.1 pyridoxamine 5-phosphate oxidase [Rhodophyticola sp. CCM32]